MPDSQERLEILNMIKNGSITPEQGVRLIEALDGPPKKSEPQSRDEIKWISIEIRSKTSGKYKSLTPVRIPISLVRLFFRFIPKDSALPGSESTIEELLDSLVAGKPLVLHSDEGEDGRSIRITAE